MTKRKWTPGPWLVQTTDGAKSGNGFDVLGSCVSGLTWINPDSNQSEAQANAHIIAAAPDLYEALENLLGVHEGKGGTKYHAGEIARAALAKASGQEE